MNLTKRRELAAKVLKVGKNRIIFVEGHLAEIKEAITRMDMQDLHKSGAIQIREVKGKAVSSEDSPAKLYDVRGEAK